MKKIVLGLSGGVDSSVCLYLLKKYQSLKKDIEVESVFMKNWDSFLNNDFSFKAEENGCESNIDFNDALNVSNFLNSKLLKVEFIKEYWENVFKSMIEKYKNGLTPNPDVLCNKYIKFLYFEKYVTKILKADLFAMGHYAGKRINKDGTFDLIMAKDKHKDQTYFLCELNQDQLKRAIFPLANITKEDVRKIAKKINLPNYNKKDSTGICFVGNRDFKKFLLNYLPIQKGSIVNMDTNKIIGEHDGIWFYTIGQRKKIGLSGMEEKYFIAKKDVQTNTIFVSSISNEDKFMYCDLIKTINFNWINKIPDNKLCLLRYRHCGELFPVTFEIINEQVIIKSKKKLRAVPCGQYAVLYQDDICLGGGEITETENTKE